MDRTKSTRSKVEFGDFQTPRSLADRIVRLLRARCLQPGSVIEPTCGEGNLLLAAADAFPQAKHILGTDINSEYLQHLKRTVVQRRDRSRFLLRCQDVFKDESLSLPRDLPEPWLVIGNPPWVTNSGLGSLGSNQVPRKSNENNVSGIEALTGQSNFDVSEWILRRIVRVLQTRHATMAMLCKTSVARKVLAYIWASGIPIRSAEIHLIDAEQEFAAAVDACLLVCQLDKKSQCQQADIYSSIESGEIVSRIGWRGNQVVANLSQFDQWQKLQVTESGKQPKWRSGIKHDCAMVLELERHSGKYRNKLGELVVLESTCLYPLVKSSDLARDEPGPARRWLLMPQRRMDEDPKSIAHAAPQTWDYLQQHIDFFARRKSSIYRDRPAFSIFGVGDYTFARWKVAVSGFYKQLQFKVVGPYSRRPRVFDDTCYFLPCVDQYDAERLCLALNSEVAQEFFSAFIFWDTKRPITAKLLRLLDVERLLAVSGDAPIKMYC